MDNGTAIIIASLVPTVSAMVNAWWVKRALVKANREGAQIVVDHNNMLAQKLDENTALTLQIEKATNGMKAELEAAKYKEGGMDERARADAAKKE